MIIEKKIEKKNYNNKKMSTPFQKYHKILMPQPSEKYLFKRGTGGQ